MSVKTKTTTRDRTSGLRYVGNGAFIPGVPARNLSPDESAEHADVISIQQELIGLIIYEPVDQPTESE